MTKETSDVHFLAAFSLNGYLYNDFTKQRTLLVQIVLFVKIHFHTNEIRNFFFFIFISSTFFRDHLFREEVFIVYFGRIEHTNNTTFLNFFHISWHMAGDSDRFLSVDCSCFCPFWKLLKKIGCQFFFKQFKKW